ncbi:MAG TPA: glycerophosphodiester phosphodiesterase family protein [Ferruginibacter sp.]|nr:glycerophosphodiester phosphodiesterase family protein [Ferruginibacter sp.]HMP21608.1 glycerophosphodiester phosphodiesterase family protein [Ferruginibacter sp.]
MYTSTQYQQPAKRFLPGKRFVVLGLIIISMACSIIPTAPAKFDKQGHRGCRGLMPENTIPALLHALDLGVTTLEMDVVFTADSVAILSHEPFFNHEITTLPNGTYLGEDREKVYNIFKMSFAQTQQYDVGLKPHPRFPQQEKIPAHKPSLEAVFDTVLAYQQKHQRPFPFFNIETKTLPHTDNVFHPAPEVFVDRLMKVIREKKMEPWVMIQSFDVRTLQYLHRQYPAIPAVLLVEDFDKRGFEAHLQWLGFTPAVYSPHYSLVDAALIEKCHKLKVKLIPWTVNDKATLDKLTVMGVDGIITDYPNLFTAR